MPALPLMDKLNFRPPRHIRLIPSCQVMMIWNLFEWETAMFAIAYVDQSNILIADQFRCRRRCTLPLPPQQSPSLSNAQHLPRALQAHLLRCKHHREWQFRTKMVAVGVYSFWQLHAEYYVVMRLECITAIERRPLYIWSHRDFAFSVKQQRSYPSRTAAFSQNAILQTRPDLLAMCLGVRSIASRQ